MKLHIIMVPPPPPITMKLHIIMVPPPPLRDNNEITYYYGFPPPPQR